MKKERIELIDAARGLAVILMVIHHFLYDCVAFLGAPVWLFTNPVLDIAHYFFAGLFIFISGTASRFSRSNVKRGIIVFAVAMGITVVTTVMKMPIRFGILHFLGFAMVFYGVTEKCWNTVPKIVMPIACTALLILTALLVRIDTGVNFLWMFGWTYPGFYSSDYFPIFPWLFVFLFGTVLGAYIREGSFPKRFYEAKPPLFPIVGRRALLIYVIHQPILYGITILLGLALNIRFW